MPFQTALHLTAHERPFVLIVEPWADEFVISGAEQCRLVASNPDAVPRLTAQIVGDGDLMVCVEDCGSTFEFWRGGVCELSNSVPTPG